MKSLCEFVTGRSSLEIGETWARIRAYIFSGDSMGNDFQPANFSLPRDHPELAPTRYRASLYAMLITGIICKLMFTIVGAPCAAIYALRIPIIMEYRHWAQVRQQRR